MIDFKEIETGLFAFWRYDRYPFILGGTVTRMNGKGRVMTEEYGPGMSFNPIKLVPVESGKTILAELGQLEEDANKERENLERKLKAKLDARLKEMGFEKP